MQGADEISRCGGCGYPAYGEDLCAFCRSIVVLTPAVPAKSLEEAAALPGT